MAKKTQPELFVVDGSNIATEGRSAPSLEQLNEAVLAFLEAHPHATVTVVVDATFGHRIAKKEVKAFDEAVANNELVTPPAGAVGRGDAFVLAIADRAKAGVLSNDSFQEFHGEYEWLFDEGRLVGGKPVPHVGWVFVARTPVRGPKSRQAIREANQDATSTKEQANRRVRKKAAASDTATDQPDSADAERAAEPPATEPAEDQAKEPVRRGRRGRGRKKAASEPIDAEQQATIEAAKAAKTKEHVNDLMPFLEFVQHHPVGTSCTAVVESYASHGAYARVDDVLVYIPLRLMDDPVPRSARSVMSVGEAVTAVIVGYVPDRRSIDAALPHMAGGPTPSEEPAAAAEPTGEPPSDAERTTDEQDGKTPARKSAAKKTTAKKTTAKKTTAKKTPAKKTPAKKAAAKKTAAKKTTAKKAAAKQTAERDAETRADAAAPADVTEAPAKQTAAKKTTAKKTTAKKTTAKKTPAKRTAATKSPTKRAPAKQTAAKKTAAEKTAAKKAPAKRSRGADTEGSGGGSS